MIKPWTTVATRQAGNFRVFSVRTVIKKSPHGGKEHEFSVIDSVNWVNVIAVTDDQQMVLVEQYRQGTDTVELEVPGGMIDKSDAGPEAAGARELREETGYEGKNPRIIGKVFPNPAIMSNTCFTVLVEHCALTAKTHFDETEDLKSVLVPVDQAARLVSEGKIRHSLVIAAIFNFELERLKKSCSHSKDKK